MRKFRLCLYAISAISLILTLASCAEKTPAPPPAAFSAEADISFWGKKFAAAVQQFSPGALRFSFTAPEELAGMELTLEADQASLHYQGLQYSQSLGTLPQASFAACLNQALPLIVVVS